MIRLSLEFYKTGVWGGACQIWGGNSLVGRLCRRWVESITGFWRDAGSCRRPGPTETFGGILLAGHFSPGSVDVLGRPFRIQQEQDACRPVRDVSLLNLVINKTHRSAKSREGPRRTPKAYRFFIAQLRGPSRTSRLLPQIAVLTNVNDP